MMSNREIEAAWCMPEVAKEQKELADCELEKSVHDIAPFAEFLRILGNLNGVEEVIDIGCATGSYGVLLKGHFPDIRYVGYDISSEMCLHARDRGLDVRDAMCDGLPQICRAGVLLLCAVSLEYAKYPPYALWRVLQRNPLSWLMLHRVRCHEDCGRKVDERSYCGLDIPMWRWNRKELDVLFENSGRQYAWHTWPKDQRQFTIVVEPEA